ncbi:MAG: hypothetical protein CMA57_05115 [Euryarchaeota archaeon]|mgnify:CR=1 FL=1|nr:hypothetical protein [Euryarchaeota archaeon]
MTEDSARELLARVTCTNLNELEHSRGIAWTAQILLDGVYAGTAEDQGMGGDVNFEPHRVTSDRLELVWEETINRADRIGEALVHLKCASAIKQPGRFYNCDVFAWLDATYEGAPMTLLDAYNALIEEDRRLGLA